MKKFCSILLCMFPLFAIAQIEEFSDDMLSEYQPKEYNEYNILERPNYLDKLLVPMNLTYPTKRIGGGFSSFVTNWLGYELYFSEGSPFDIVNINQNNDSLVYGRLKKGSYEVTGYIFCEEDLEYIRGIINNPKAHFNPAIPKSSSSIFDDLDFYPTIKETPANKYLDFFSQHKKNGSMSRYGDIPSKENMTYSLCNNTYDKEYLACYMELTGADGWKHYLYLKTPNVWNNGDFFSGDKNYFFFTHCVLVANYEANKDWLLSQGPLLLARTCMISSDFDRNHYQMYNRDDSCTFRDINGFAHKINLPMQAECKKVAAKHDSIFAIFSIKDSLFFSATFEMTMDRTKVEELNDRVSYYDLRDFPFDLFHEDEYKSIYKSCIEISNLRKKNPDLAKKAKQDYLAKRKNQRESELEEYEGERAMNIVDSYGETLGTLILDRKVQVGMTTQMCILAWGNPSYVYTDGEYLVWQYSPLCELRFKDDVLSSIRMRGPRV